MVASTIVTTVQNYLRALPAEGIHPSQAILFGSFARGNDHQWSDIDLVVIAPEFDGPRETNMVEQLWLATASSDNRIEPIPCGEKEWQTDEARPILDGHSSGYDAGPRKSSIPLSRGRWSLDIIRHFHHLGACVWSGPPLKAFTRSGDII